MPKGEPVSTHEQRQKWLDAHPEFKTKTKREVVAAMKKAGLFSKSTFWEDVEIPGFGRHRG